jgi:large subunit ribosomal protein L4
MVALLAAAGIEKGLIMLAQDDANVVLSARNIPNVEVTTVASVNPVSLVAHEKILMSADTAKLLDEKLS